MYAEDVSPEARDLRVMAKMLENTDKHLSMRALTKNNLSHLIKMGAVVAGGKEQLKKRPVISFLESSIAPLRFPDIFVEVLVVCGEYGESIFEESLCTYVTAFAGNPSILCGAGALELGLIASHEEMVITDEIFAVLRRILEGIEVSDERLGADAIARVGIGGNYLTDEHTMKYLRSERYQSPFVKPKTRDSWISSGSKSFVQRAKEKALTILQEHQAAPLDKMIVAEVREVIHKAEKDDSVVSRK